MLDVTEFAFVDTETVSLWPPKGDQIWEYGGVTINPDHTLDKLRLQIRPNLYTANGPSLQIGRFFERFNINLLTHPVGTGNLIMSEGDVEDWSLEDITPFIPEIVAGFICDQLKGRKVFYSNPPFDHPRLVDFVRSNGLVETWHYHGYDMPSMVAGFLLSRGNDLSSIGTRYLYEKYGFTQKESTVHTALGDAEHLAELFISMAYDAESE